MRGLFVTGGSGFIGSNFIRYILREFPHYSVLNYDNLTYAGNPENLKDLESSANYEFIHGDIDNVKKVVDSMQLGNCTAVINFAAESHVDRSISSAREFMTTNVLGTQSLLEAARYLQISRVIHVSTDEVYGSIDKGSFTEESLLSPSSPYSASKAASDLVCNAYRVTHDMPIIVTRSSNNFGPYQYPEKLIPLLITKAMADESLPIYGDGKNVRDWIYVEDNCAAIATVLHKGELGEVYNIGGGNELKNIEVVKTILKTLGKPESLISYVDDRLGHDRRYSINCDKVKKLGWKPQHDFEKALEKTIEWYSSNTSWCEALQGRV